MMKIKFIVLIVFSFGLCLFCPIRTSADIHTQMMEKDPTFMVESTAYYNPNNNRCADGSYPISGLTVAGKREWLGKTCAIYSVASDGSIGDFMGYYEFRDTGFGNDKDGNGIGSIQEGTCIDIYFDTKEECINYGRRNVYIQVIDSKGWLFKAL